MLVVSCLAIAANAQLRQSHARAPERNPGARPSGDRSAKVKTWIELLVGFRF